MPTTERDEYGREGISVVKFSASKKASQRRRRRRREKEKQKRQSEAVYYERV